VNPIRPGFIALLAACALAPTGNAVEVPVRRSGPAPVPFDDGKTYPGAKDVWRKGEHGRRKDLARMRKRQKRRRSGK
jgi:hypothetical protein